MPDISSTPHVEVPDFLGDFSCIQVPTCSSGCRSYLDVCLCSVLKQSRSWTRYVEVRLVLFLAEVFRHCVKNFNPVNATSCGHDNSSSPGSKCFPHRAQSLTIDSAGRLETPKLCKKIMGMLSVNKHVVCTRSHGRPQLMLCLKLCIPRMAIQLALWNITRRGCSRWTGVKTLMTTSQGETATWPYSQHYHHFFTAFSAHGLRQSLSMFFA